jgi:predicted enzyme related to lactoylglutathione lyase
VKKQWMINFRVGDLDKMAEQLEAAGITVKVDPMTYPNGRFARIHDPEGNPIELWQPLKAVTVKEGPG